jgi:hypothetical protein
MKYTKLFNNYEEYVAYTASTSFVRPNVSWCDAEGKAYCTPPVFCEETHEYAVVGSPTYPESVPAIATSFDLSFNYTDTYTAMTCEESMVSSSETVSIAIEPNQSESARTISGVYTFHGISIPYSLTQEGTQEIPYSQRYLTLDVLTGGTILWKASTTGISKTISYSKNEGLTWTEITSTTGGTAINVDAGDKVLLKGSNAAYGSGKDVNSGFMGGTASYNVEGNVMSLIGGDNFSGLTSFNGYTYVFH